MSSDPSHTVLGAALSHKEDAWADQPRWLVRLLALVSGIALAASVPPWGWWPLAFIGIALIDQLLATASPRARFGRMWLAAVGWLAPAMLWMWDLTPPGYVIAVVAYAAYFGLGAALTPHRRPLRMLILPATLTLAEIVRWYWPFGGVPLANLALSQVNTPLGQTARLAGPLLVMITVIVMGQTLSVLIDVVRDRPQRPSTATLGPILVAAGVVLGLIGAAALHPRARVIGELATASVQGGGPTRTRASIEQAPVVFGRHLEATKAITEPVDLILWPENVVNPGSLLSMQDAQHRVAEIAQRYDAVMMPGWFYAVSDTGTVNYHTSVGPDGVELDRYDKVRIVPFGEFVPLRGFIEWTGLGAGIPRRDVIAGTEPAVVDTPFGPIGVSISWEGFFERRARESVNHGAVLLTNPTNGASYWLTQVHTQQVASNQLRAIETDRWVLMVGPTGMSAVIDPDGTVLQRSGIGERVVLEQIVDLRTGRTLAARVGLWPVLLYATTGTLAGVWLTHGPTARARRSAEASDSTKEKIT